MVGDTPQWHLDCGVPDSHQELLKLVIYSETPQEMFQFIAGPITVPPLQYFITQHFVLYV